MAGGLCVLMEGKLENRAGAELGSVLQLWTWLLHKRQSCLRIRLPQDRASCVLFSLHGRHHVCAL